MLAKRAASGAEPPAPSWSLTLGVVAVVVGVHTIWNQRPKHHLNQAKCIEEKELKQQAAEANWTKEDVDNLRRPTAGNRLAQRGDQVTKKHIFELARQVVPSKRSCSTRVQCKTLS